MTCSEMSTLNQHYKSNLDRICFSNYWNHCMDYKNTVIHGSNDTCTFFLKCPSYYQQMEIRYCIKSTRILKNLLHLFPWSKHAQERIWLLAWTNIIWSIHQRAPDPCISRWFLNDSQAFEDITHTTGNTRGSNHCISCHTRQLQNRRS